MRAEGTRKKFGVKLATQHEGVLFDFGNFDKIALRIVTGNSKSAHLERIAIIVVYLITVAVAFENRFLAVQLPRDGILSKLATVSPQPHRPAFFCESFVGRE